LSVSGERCPSCDALLVAPARFCAHCGTVIPADVAGSRSSERQEELRQITAVFCDIVGSTELSTRFDPEEYADLVRAYQRQVDEVLKNYGGTVGKYLGDGILIEFGWPRAHDDDVERAVLAALAIIEALGDSEADPLSVRIGIHTGPVLVGEMGSDRHQETAALGETMNRAARLQACAPAGGVVISDSSLRLVRGIFVVEDLGPQELPGIADPVTAYRVLRRSGVRSKLDAAGDRVTPFVSRGEELATMLELWGRACGGEGQTVLLTGEPGIGKSRLVYELRERLSDTAHTWLEARASSYTQHTAFQPAIQLIEQALEIVPQDGPAERMTKLEATFEQVNVGDPDAVPLLADLLGLGAEASTRAVMSPDLARRRTIEVLARWVLALAEMQPLVLLAEDLHWCDPSTLDLFEQLIVQGSHATLMLVGTARDELEADWVSNPMLTRIELSPLSQADTRELLRRLASGRTLPEAVLDRVVGETDGIPLFAEEVGRMVMESGLLAEREGALELTAPLQELAIPTTLQDSLMARLDRLSAAKRVAQLASAIGREFDYGLLEEVGGLESDPLRHGLRRLTEDELIFESGTPPDATYTFKHALIQDAAYHSLPRRSRRPLHAKIAEALERRSEELAVAPEVLAHHWEAADRPREAIDYYRSAAEEAAGHSAHREAIQHLGKAIELVGALPEERPSMGLEVELQVALGASIMAIRGYADPEVEAAYERAHSLCDELGQGNQAGYTLVGLAIYYLNGGQLERGVELALQALELGHRHRDAALRILAQVQLAIPRLFQGRFAEALEHADAGCALYEPERCAWLASRYGTDQGVAGHSVAAIALAHLGFADRGLERSREATDLARTVGRPFDIAYARTFESWVHLTRGELSAQRDAASEVVEICDKQGFPDFGGLARMFRATARAEAGEDAQSALDECLEGASLAAGTGRRAAASGFVVALATAQLAAGKLEDAIGTIDAGIAEADRTGQPFWNADLLRMKAETLFRLGNGRDREAESVLNEAIELARSQGNRLHELKATTALTRHLRERGDDGAGAAEGALRAAYEGFTEGFETAPLREAAELLSLNELRAPSAP
jgi:predicted ATPase/class 3 adenylate cyclase